MTVEIRQVAPGGRLDDFLEVVDYIYRDDPNYVRPLDMEVKGRLAPTAPFFEHGEATVFTAHRNGWCVGRITAQIDRLHLERYGEDVGFFGFFDTIDDQEVANALLEAATGWLRDRGMKAIRGPLSLTVNDELGVLVDGFDTPPAVMMPHHLPYQSKLLEGAGFTKNMDFFAWRYEVGDVPRRARKAYEEIEAMPEVKSRHMNPRDVDRELRMVMDVYNEAWCDNWGFVPFTEKELKKLADDFRMILVPEITLLTFIDGEVAAVGFAIPNLNELIRDIGGKLFRGPFHLPLPVGLAKLLYRLKVQGAKSGRLIILGIKKKFRTQKKYGGLSAYLYTKMNDSGAKVGMTWGELSWTAESNAPVNTGIKLMGGKIYKTYRVYDRPISG